MLIVKKNINSLSESEYLSVLKSMPDKKQNEIRSYRNEADKKRSVCGYMIAIKALGDFLGIDGDEIKISYLESGQPVFDGAFLSITHAGDFAVCAVSDKKIGIDAETKRKVSLKPALRICTENELKYIFGQDFDRRLPENPSEDEYTRFLEIWTKKEAYGKMLGTGILYDMKNTDVLHIKTVTENELIISVCEE